MLPLPVTLAGVGALGGLGAGFAIQFFNSKNDKLLEERLGITAVSHEYIFHHSEFVRLLDMIADVRQYDHACQLFDMSVTKLNKLLAFYESSMDIKHWTLKQGDSLTVSRLRTDIVQTLYNMEKVARHESRNELKLGNALSLALPELRTHIDGVRDEIQQNIREYLATPRKDK